MASGRNFTEDSASDTSLAVQEAQAWIEAVTEQKFKASFRDSLEDGIILCELIQTIRPGCIRKINRRSNPIAHLDNIRQFLGACKELGLKDAQLFEVTDLQPPNTLARKESSNNVLRRSDAVRRIRSVCVTLFWLGNVASTLKDYTGPQLDLKAFKEILAGGEAEGMEELVPRHVMSYPGSKPGAQSGTKMEAFTEDLEKTNPSLTPEPNVKFGLTFEQEQTADQLLADIQNAVDEMLNTYKPPTSEEIPPERSPTPEIDQLPFIESPTDDGPLTTVTINMRSRNGGFGCQIVGGADSESQAKVELVVPGSAAEVAGLLAGDFISSIGGVNVEYLTHMEIVDLIRKGGAAGGVILSVLRRSVLPVVPHEQEIEAPANFAEVQDIAHSAEHSLDSLEWAQTINVGTTPHENKQALIGSRTEEGKRDFAHINDIAVQPSQEPKEEPAQPVKPVQLVQPAVPRVESVNQFQRPSSSQQHQSASSKTLHVVKTSWAGSVEQPQQVSLWPPAEPKFPQRGGVQEEVASTIRKLPEGVASVSLVEEQREAKYSMPKVAGLSGAQVSPPGAQETSPQASASSLSLQAARTATPPQSSGYSSQLSALSLQAVPPTSQTSQNVSNLSQVAFSTLPQASQYVQKVSSSFETSAPIQSSRMDSPPQTSAPPQSSQLFTPPQTSALLQSSQTVAPSETSGTPQVSVPPSSLSLSPEVEHHGTLKIQKVQRTRWTPKGQTDAQREQSHSEASTPAKSEARQLLDPSASGGTVVAGPPAGRSGSLHRTERGRLADQLPQQATQPYVPLQSSTPTHTRPVQRSMSDRRQHVIQQLPPPLAQHQPPKQQQQYQTQVALVSHGLYATVTYKQDTCTRCRRPLQQPGVVQPGFVMTVAAHKLQYHITCFTCAVCRSPLSYDSRGESTVLIQRGEIHCKFCSSNNQGTKTTEC